MLRRRKLAAELFRLRPINERKSAVIEADTRSARKRPTSADKKISKLASDLLFLPLKGKPNIKGEENSSEGSNDDAIFWTKR